MTIKAVIGSVLMYFIITFFTSFLCPVRALPEPPRPFGSATLSCPENCKLTFTENGQKLLHQLLGMNFRYTVIVPNVRAASNSTVTDKDLEGMELNYSWMLLKNSTGRPYLQVYQFFVALSMWTLKNEVYDFEVDIVQKPDSCWKDLNLECRLYGITSAILSSISVAMTEVSLNGGDLQLCVKSYLRNVSLPLKGGTGCRQNMLFNRSKENVTLDYVKTPRLESAIVLIVQTFFTGSLFFFLPLLILKAIPSRYSVYLSDVAQEELQKFEYYNNLTPCNELFFAPKVNRCLTILYRVLAFVIVHAMIIFSIVTNLRLYRFVWKGHCAYTNLLRVTILTWIFTHPVSSAYTCMLLDIQPWVGYLGFAVALTFWSFVFVVFVTPVHTYHNLASGAFFKDIGVTFLANPNAGFPPNHICLVASLRRHLEPRTFFHVLKKAFKSNVLYSVLMPFILPFMPVGFVFVVMLGMQLSKMDCNPLLRRMKLPYAFLSIFPFLYFVFLLIDTCSTICWVVTFTVSGLFINSDQNLPYLVFMVSGLYYIYRPFHTMQEKYRTLKTIVFKAYDECRKAKNFSDSDSSSGTTTGEDSETFRLLELPSSNYFSEANRGTRDSRRIQIERPPKQPSYLHASGIRKMEKALWNRIFTQILPLKRQLFSAVILALLSFLILVVIMFALHGYHQVQRLKTIGKSFASLAAAALPQLIINFIRAPTEQTIQEKQWRYLATDMILDYMGSVY